MLDNLENEILMDTAEMRGSQRVASPRPPAGDVSPSATIVVKVGLFLVNRKDRQSERRQSMHGCHDGRDHRSSVPLSKSLSSLG